LKDSEVTAIVTVPVELTANKFLPVSELPSMADLPNLPERMRDYGFRCGIEYRPDREWAEIFGVNTSTIGRWKRDPRVQQIIALTKYERRAYLFGQMVRLERGMFAKLDEILNAKITGDTIGPILQTIKFVHGMLNGEGDPSSNEKSQFNVSIGLAPGQGYGERLAGRPSAFGASEPRDVSPEQVQKIEANITRAEAILTNYQAMIEVGGNGDGDDS
jgi:hypothetical protein